MHSHVAKTQLDYDEGANLKENLVYADNGQCPLSIELLHAWWSWALPLHHRHDDDSDTANDFGVGRVADSPDLLPGLRSRDKEQLVSIEITPGANTAVSQFDKVDRTLDLSLPATRLYCSLAGIDLHQRARANPGVHGMVFTPDVGE